MSSEHRPTTLRRAVLGIAGLGGLIFLALELGRPMPPGSLPPRAVSHAPVDGSATGLPPRSSGTTAGAGGSGVAEPRVTEDGEAEGPPREVPGGSVGAGARGLLGADVGAEPLEADSPPRSEFGQLCFTAQALRSRLDLSRELLGQGQYPPEVHDFVRRHVEDTERSLVNRATWAVCDATEGWW